MMELLLFDGIHSGPPVLVPQLGATVLEPMAVALLEAATSGRLRVLPGPAADASSRLIGDWHRDAWTALPAAERSSVAVATGPGVAALAPLIEGAEAVFTVREPLEAVSALVGEGSSLPSRRALAALRDEPGLLPKPQMRQLSNPQARALLLASAKAGDLPVTVGPPSDADRWRNFLFEDAWPRIRPIAVEGLSAAAGELAAQLGYAPDACAHASEIAERLASRHDRPSIDPVRAELIQELNWLDDELFERCQPVAE
jgi:hypothetical protein